MAREIYNTPRVDRGVANVDADADPLLHGPLLRRRRCNERRQRCTAAGIGKLIRLRTWLTGWMHGDCYQRIVWTHVSSRQIRNALARAPR